MNNLLLPDFFAMAVLLAVLIAVRRRHPDHDIQLWLGGLALILLQCAARIAYGLHLPDIWHRVAHVIALDAYLLAGLLFLRSAVRALRRMPRANLYLVLVSMPGVALLTAYGAGATSSTAFWTIAVFGAAAGAIAGVVLRRPPMYTVTLLALWLSAAAGLLAHSPRMAVYWALAMLYLLLACVFFRGLPVRSSGKIAVTTGFALSSSSFAIHPWVAIYHPDWSAFAGEVWDLQKFVITVGFLLLLFEKQVDTQEWLALHDELTGLPNRRLLEDRIGSAIARAERSGASLVLFMLDLNNFKQVNDVLGHNAGDAVLRRVAARLRQVVRRTDTLARISGDEFVLLATDIRPEHTYAASAGSAGGFAGRMDAPGSSASLVTRIEQSLRAAVSEPITVQTRGGDVRIEVSTSVGFALWPADSSDRVELGRLADERMYEDKRRQRSQRGADEPVVSIAATA